MTLRRAAIVTLGRDAGMGERRRVDSWSMILREAGLEPAVVRLMSSHRTAYPTDMPRNLASIVAGTSVPEAISWSASSVRSALATLTPSVIVVVTARAFSPGIVPRGHTVVLDLVDELSTSYRDRSALVEGWPRRAGFRVLAAAHRRFERRSLTLTGVNIRTAAGRRDAETLGARWLPNVIDVPPTSAADDRSHDLLFFGNLSYLPNVAALKRLADCWPDLQDRRPGTTLVVAGKYATPEVREMAGKHGWNLHGPYSSLASLGGLARVAVAPIDHVAGMQNKVLEAAALGMAQVVSRRVSNGFDPAFPVRIADDNDDLVSEIVDLLDVEGAWQREGAAALDHVNSHYSAGAWATRLEQWLDPGRALAPLPG